MSKKNEKAEKTISLFDIQSQLIEKLQKEGINNKDLFALIYAQKTVADAKKKFKNAILKKQKIITLNKNINKLDKNIECDFDFLIKNIGTKKSDEGISKVESIISFIIYKKKVIEISQKENFPPLMKLYLKSASNRTEILNIIKSLPEIVRVNNDLLKIKAAYPGGTKSIKSISANMWRG